MTIYEKILEVMKDVQYLAKDDKVEFGSTKYKAISEEKVTSIMRQELLKHRMVVFPVCQEESRQGNITHVNVKYKLVNVDDPEDWILISSAGDGADTQDKGTGKAMTYAYKYMWLRTFAIPTGEDPDKISSAELDAREAKEKAVDPKDAPPSEETVALYRSLVTDDQWNKTVERYGPPPQWTDYLTQRWIKKLLESRKANEV